MQGTKKYVNVNCFNISFDKKMMLMNRYKRKIPFGRNSPKGIFRSFNFVCSARVNQGFKIIGLPYKFSKNPGIAKSYYFAQASTASPSGWVMVWSTSIRPQCSQASTRLCRPISSLICGGTRLKQPPQELRSTVATATPLR